MSIQDQNAIARPLPPPPPDWQPEPLPKKGGTGKVLALLVVLLLLLSILFVTPLGRTLFNNLTSKSYPESSEFTMYREITIDIRSGEIEWALDIPVPVNISSSDGPIQTIQSIEPFPNVPATMKYGGEWMQWTGVDNTPVTLLMNYRATVRTVVWNIKAEDSGMASDIPSALLARQGGNEWELKDNAGNPTGDYVIWPSHPDIRQLSGTLTEDILTVYENIRNVYDYMRENYNYETVPNSEPKSCLQTLSDGSGDCDDQSILMVSLLRAAGIPSWLAFGILYDEVKDQWGGHAWVEVYIPLGSGTGGSVAIDVVNGEFLVRNCNRLEEWKSDGNGEHLSDYYHMLGYNYTLNTPHQNPPVVILKDDCTGNYLASEKRVYGCIDIYEYLVLTPSRPMEC